MVYCKNCGSKLDEGAELCPNCGRAVTGAASGETAPYAPRPQVPPYARVKPGKFNTGDVDYSKLNNVSLITEPAQHTVLHIAVDLVGYILVIYYLIVFSPVLIPALTGAETSPDIPFDPAAYPPVFVTFLILIICVFFLSMSVLPDVYEFY